MICITSHYPYQQLAYRHAALPHQMISQLLYLEAPPILTPPVPATQTDALASNRYRLNKAREEMATTRRSSVLVILRGLFFAQSVQEALLILHGGIICSAFHKCHIKRSRGGLAIQRPARVKFNITEPIEFQKLSGYV